MPERLKGAALSCIQAILVVTALTAVSLLGACSGTPAAADVDESVDATPVSVAPATAAPIASPSSTPATAPQPASDTPAPPEQGGDTRDDASETQHADVAARVQSAMDTFANAQQFSGAVLVAREGQVIFSRGYGYADRANAIPNDAQTRYRIGSVTKPFTAMLILMLHERGLVDIDDSICDYVEECPDGWQQITISHLLAHTGGVPDFTRFPDYESTKGRPTTLHETIDRFRDVPLEFPPGERWNYTNSGYILLGKIIETVTGRPFEEVAQEYLFEPLGMADTGYDHNRDDLAVGYANADGAPADFIDMSIPHAAGGLYSSAEDLLKWDRALAAGALVSAELQTAMQTAHAQIPDSPNLGYGYGWVVSEEFDQPMVYHSGGIEGYVANITRLLGDDTLVVILSNQEQTNPRAVMRTVIEAVYGGE